MKGKDEHGRARGRVLAHARPSLIGWGGAPENEKMLRRGGRAWKSAGERMLWKVERTGNQTLL